MAESSLMGSTPTARGGVAPLDPSVSQAGDSLPPIIQMKNLMKLDSWSVTQGFVQWGIVWENTKAGLVTPYNEDSQMVMLSPFTFFNATPQVIQLMFSRAVPTFLHQFGQYQTDEIYAKANPMPWLVLQTFAPTFALSDVGVDAQQQVFRLIAEMRERNDPPFEGPNNEQPRPEPPRDARSDRQSNRRSTGRPSR